MLIRARWTGEYPHAGDVLRSTGAARFGYVIASVKELSPGRLALTVERVTVAELEGLPRSTRVWPWKWDARGRRHAGKKQVPLG